MFFYRELPKYLSSITVFCFLFMFSFQSHGIVNMNGLHFNKNADKFSADVDLLFTGSSGNSDSSTTAINSQFSWVTDKNINLFMFGTKEGASNGLRNINKAFSHYRYIQNISNTIDWEVFAQVERNEFTRLSSRRLLGAGMRFNISNDQNHHGFLGIGVFNSREEIEFKVGYSDDGIEELTRFNFYLLSKFKVKPSVEFSNTIYYQPDGNKFSDFRALLQSKLDFSISKKLSFRISLDAEFDSVPSETIKKGDMSYTAGFKYSY